MRRAEETAVKFRQVVRTPHNGKAEGAQKDNPIPAIGPFLGLLEIGLERAGCWSRLCPPSALRKQPAQLSMHRRGKNKHNRKRRKSEAGAMTHRVRLTHKWKKAACREAQGKIGVCPRRGALPYLGTIIDLSDLPEQQ